MCKMTRSRSALWLSVALILIGSVLLGRQLITTRMAAMTLTTAIEAPTSDSPSSAASLVDPRTTGPNENDDRNTDPPQRLDLRGNEIARPVAGYRIDQHGSLYEVHSPQTEVPRLKSPVM
jgi:hypothetical protein